MKKQSLFGRLRRSFQYSLSLSYWRTLGYLFIVFVAVLALVMFVLWVASSCNRVDLGDVNVPGTAFMLLTDPGNVSDVFTHNGLWWMGIAYAVIVMLGALLFGGLLISFMSNTIQLMVDDFKNGNVHYVHSNHIIVIGYDALVPALVRQLVDAYPQKDILVFTWKNSQEVREALSTLVNVKDRHLVLYSGRRDSFSDLEKLQPEKAEELFIIGNRENDDHDALNFACLSKLVEIVKGAQVTNKPVVNILLENQSTQVILQSTNLAQEWQKYIRVIPFNFYENWARQVFAAVEVFSDEKMLPKPGDADAMKQPEACRYPHIQVNKDSEERVNIVIFGMSDLGLTVGVEAAHALHFPQLPDGGVRKTKITFISKFAKDEMSVFRARYRQIFEIQSSSFIDYIGEAWDRPEDLPRRMDFAPSYFTGKDADFLDIEFEFIRGDAFSEEIHQLLKDRVSDTNCKMSVFTCTGNDSADMNIGLLLPEDVLRQANVFIRQHHTGQLLTWLHQINKEGGGKYANVYPFGMANSQFDLSHRNLEMGVLINYYYLRRGAEETYRADHLMTTEECSQALKAWNEETSISDQWSSSYCCNSFALKLAQFGVESIGEENMKEIQDTVAQNLETLAYIEHNRWNMEKLLLGYRKPNREEASEIEKCRKTIADNTQDQALKPQCKFRYYKAKCQVHDYLRSFEDLGTIQWAGKTEEDDVRKIDYNMLRQIPWIIKNRRQINALLKA